jgi:uncharacterized protein YndB with AHSA1/START domain
VRLDFVVEELLPHPVETVWRALTEAEAISDWLMRTTDFRPIVGARFRLKTQHLSAGGWIDAEVLELDPPRRMSWSWSADGSAASTVTFELAADGDGTRLRLTHEGEIDPEAGRIVSAGWPGRLERLATVAARRTT